MIGQSRSLRLSARNEHGGSPRDCGKLLIGLLGMDWLISRITPRHWCRWRLSSQVIFAISRSSQVVLLETRGPWRLNWKARGGRIDGARLDDAPRRRAPASGAGAMQDWVGEAREVRVNAPEVAHRAQEEAALLDQRLDRVGIGEPAGRGGTAQEAHA